jgi:hypothetical protein
LYLNDALMIAIAQLFAGLGIKSVERVYFDRFEFYAYYARGDRVPVPGLPTWLQAIVRVLPESVVAQPEVR